MFSKVQNVEPNTPTINQSSPFANGLVAAYYGTDYNAVTGKMLTRNGTMDRQNSSKGKGLSNWGASSYLDDLSIPFVKPPFTLVSIVGNARTIFGYGGQNTGYGWVVVAAAPNTSNGLRLTYGFIADYLFPSVHLTSNNPTVIGVSVGASTATSFVDGAKKDTISVGTVSSNAPQNARIGAIYDGTSIINTPASGAFIGTTLLWNRQLTDAEMQSITANPWQVFAPNARQSINAIRHQIPAPNPTYRKSFAMGYYAGGFDTSTYPSGQNTLAVGNGVSTDYYGYYPDTTWSNTWSTPSSTVLTVAPSAGDFLFLSIATAVGSSGAASTVTDNAGGVWTNIVNAEVDNSNNRHSFWYCASAPAGMTAITMTFVGGYPSTVRALAQSYKNMTNTALLRYSPQKYITNPGTTAGTITSNTSFVNSSNTAGLYVEADRALVIGYTFNATGLTTSTWTAGEGFQTRSDYSRIHLQDREYIAGNTAVISPCSEVGGSSNSYTSYAFAFSQPVEDNSCFYQAVAGDVVTKVRMYGGSYTGSTIVGTSKFDAAASSTGGSGSSSLTVSAGDTLVAVVTYTNGDAAVTLNSTWGTWVEDTSLQRLSGNRWRVYYINSATAASATVPTLTLDAARDYVGLYVMQLRNVTYSGGLVNDQNSPGTGNGILTAGNLPVVAQSEYVVGMCVDFSQLSGESTPAYSTSTSYSNGGTAWSFGSSPDNMQIIYKHDTSPTKPSYYTALFDSAYGSHGYRTMILGFSSATNAAIGLRRVDNNQIVYSQTVSVGAGAASREYPVAWPLSAGIVYAPFVAATGPTYGVVLYQNQSFTKYYGEKSTGTSYTVGSTWENTPATSYGGTGDSNRPMISAEVTNTYGIKYKTSGVFYPSSATATSPVINVEKGDLVLFRVVYYDSSATTPVISDNMGNFVNNSTYFNPNVSKSISQELGAQEQHVADAIMLSNKTDYQFTVTGSIAPTLVQYAVYSSPYSWEILSTARGTVYGIGFAGPSETSMGAFPRVGTLAVSMGDSGNTTPTTGDYLTPDLSTAAVRTSVSGINATTPASLIHDNYYQYYGMNNEDFRFSSNLGSSNGKTAPWSRTWLWASGPDNYRQAAGRTSSGSITLTRSTKARSLLLVFCYASNPRTATVTDDQNTVYTQINVDTVYGNQYNAVFYGYPKTGTTTFTVTGAYEAFVVEEPEMYFDSVNHDVVDSISGRKDYVTMPYTISGNTSGPAIGYAIVSYVSGGHARLGLKSVGSTLWSPVLGTGSICPITGELTSNTSWTSGTTGPIQIFRAELPSAGKWDFVLSGDRNPNPGVALLFLKRRVKMWGPNISNWNQTYGYITNPDNASYGGITGSYYRAGYKAEYSGLATCIKYKGSGVTTGVFFAIYDENGNFLTKSTLLSDDTTNSSGIASFAVSLYLEKGKTYYVAGFTNKAYQNIHLNRLVTVAWGGVTGNTWSYSYSSPPESIASYFSSSGGEPAIWVEGIPGTVKQFDTGVFDAGKLIEGYE